MTSTIKACTSHYFLLKIIIWPSFKTATCFKLTLFHFLFYKDLTRGLRIFENGSFILKANSILQNLHILISCLNVIFSITCNDDIIMTSSRQNNHLIITSKTRRLYVILFILFCYQKQLFVQV